MLRFIIATVSLAFIASGSAIFAQEEIVIGEYASLTGGSASFGQSSHKGTALAIDEINARRRAGQEAQADYR
jgi:ABC-type branched-chain amino acid transport systems, periplasmic component